MGIFAPVPGPTPLQVRRGGEAALWLALAGSIGLALMLAVVVPERAWLVPVGLLGACGLVWLAGRPVIAIYAALALLVTALNKDDGLQTNQVIYGLFAYLMLGGWYAAALLRGTSLIRSSMDKLVAFLLLAGLPLGIVTGVALGADPTLIRGEVIAYSMLAFYFPVKEICRHERHGPLILASIIIFVGVFVTLRNLASFREIMLAATQDWQIADARAGQGSGFNLNETQLVAGILMAFSLLLIAKRGSVKILLLGVLALTVFGLVMTRSRAPWVVCLVGLGFIFLFVRGKSRMKLLAAVSGAGAATLVGTYLILGPAITDLILGGTLQRLSTLSGATTTDISWLHRIGEAQAVLSKAVQSPILGWGLGASYEYYDIIMKFTYTGHFVHNGYVALWFKLGIWGLVVFISLWWGIIIRILRSLRTVTIPPANRALLLATGGYLIGWILLCLTSNPFPVRDQLLFLTLGLALGEGLVQRYGIGGRFAVTGEMSAK
jgi:O-antigen ligase